MITILQDRFNLYSNFELINDDVLKVNLQELIKKEKKENAIRNVKIVANLAILYNNANYNEIIRRKIRFRKHNSYDTKGSC